MPISPFVAELRKKVGTDLLMLTGVSVVVVNDRREILLVHSKESRGWMPIGGMIEPGEEPADTAVREVFEETGVRVKPIRLIGVYDGPDSTYDNGDRVHYITIAFLCQHVSGEPSAHDDENSEARYFPADKMPEMLANYRRNIDVALADRPEAFFLVRDA